MPIAQGLRTELHMAPVVSDSTPLPESAFQQSRHDALSGKLKSVACKGVKNSKVRSGNNERGTD
eukprot:6202127-Pleurochrysis_carterae.AAC.1